MAIHATALSLALAAALAGLAGAQTDRDFERRQLADGQAIAQRNCAQCHAIAQTGESAMKGAPRLRDLGERYPFESLAEALRGGMLAEHPAMPELRLTTGEVESLIVYLRSLQTVRQAGL